MSTGHRVGGHSAEGSALAEGGGEEEASGGRHGDGVIGLLRAKRLTKGISSVCFEVGRSGGVDVLLPGGGRDDGAWWEVMSDGGGGDGAFDPADFLGHGLEALVGGALGGRVVPESEEDADGDGGGEPTGPEACGHGERFTCLGEPRLAVRHPGRFP